MDLGLKILNLTKRLYPTGRAFNIFPNSWKEAYYKGLIRSEIRAYNDVLSIFNSILPDNDLFDTTDARLWERRLGIYGNENSLIQDRKSAISRKINYPGEAKARQHYLYIQGELQKAGFNVYIHENIFNGLAKNPIEIVGADFNSIHSEDVQHGQIQHGSYSFKLVANSIYHSVDKKYNLNDNYRNIFYIGGSTLGNYASVPQSRELEFRDLILNLKPTQMVGILLVNYT